MIARMLWISSVFLILLWIAGCRPNLPGEEDSPEPRAIPRPPQQVGLEEQVRGVVRAYLSSQTQTPSTPAQRGTARVTSAQPVEWPDACLGLGLPGENCAQVQTSGWSMEVQVDSVTYKIRVNQDGSHIRFQNPAMSMELPTAQPTSANASGNDMLPVPNQGTGTIPDTGPASQPGIFEGPYHAIARAVIKEVGRAMNVPDAAIEVVSVLPVNWPNSCLGDPPPGTQCSDVITPGYQAVVVISGVYYEVRTNRNATNFRIGSGVRPDPNSRPGEPVIPPPPGDAGT